MAVTENSNRRRGGFLDLLMRRSSECGYGSGFSDIFGILEPLVVPISMLDDLVTVGTHMLDLNYQLGQLCARNRERVPAPAPSVRPTSPFPARLVASQPRREHHDLRWAIDPLRHCFAAAYDSIACHA